MREGRPSFETLSDQRRFELKAGDHLDRSRAPAIQGRPFAIRATFQAGAGHPDGVIVAQGGMARGFSLFLKAGRPHFAIRSDEALHAIEGPALTPGEHLLTASLDAGGSLTLGVDGRAVTGPSPGKLVAKMPADGLDVGGDRGAPVGPYASPNAYPGMIKGVVTEVDRR